MSLGFHGRADVNRNMPKLNLQNGLEISNTQDTDTKLSVSVRLPEPKKSHNRNHIYAFDCSGCGGCSDVRHAVH